MTFPVHNGHGLQTHTLHLDFWSQEEAMVKVIEEFIPVNFTNILVHVYQNVDIAILRCHLRNKQAHCWDCCLIYLRLFNCTCFLRLIISLFQ